MPVKYLDPTLDIVFKLLLLSTPELLRDMIEAVLDPPTPIESVEILNPEIPKSFPSSSGQKDPRERVCFDVAITWCTSLRDHTSPG